MMNEWHLLLTPLAVLAVFVLFRFVGCSSFTSADPVTAAYDVAVGADAPVSYWRLQEPAGATTAKDERGLGNGTYDKAASPLAAGAPALKSTAVNPTVVETGVAGPPPLLNLLAGEPPELSMRVRGGFVKVPFAGPLNPPEFTLEAVVFPEWDLSKKGSFFCVIESSSPLATEPAKAKKLGYALYAGPDNPADPSSPYHWQFWVGNGTAFVRLKTKLPLAHPGPNENGEINPGPAVGPVPTYLAATYSATEAFLFVYDENRDWDFVKYELDHQTYKAAGLADLFIGISGPTRRALFSPPGPNQFLYPFNGRLAEVAVYGKVLSEPQIVSHMGSAFHR